MMVRVYDVAPDGAQTYRGEYELLETFGDGAADPEYRLARSELARTGRYWLGGGAAPLILLNRIA